MMEAKILDGRAFSYQMKKEIARRISELRRRGVIPKLGTILVGDEPGSLAYLRSKERSCKEAGIETVNCQLPREASESEVIKVIDEWNHDPGCHGILVQLPLPPQIAPTPLLERLDPRKDVDGITPTNLGRLLSDMPGFLPPTPAGILELLNAYKIELEGRYVVILGRSLVVGRSLANLLLRKGVCDATVTICHRKTKNLTLFTREADLLVAGMGSPRFVKADMVKPGAVVVDVGMNEEGGKLVGDVDFETVSRVAGWITPVPGGVGPMTVAMLLRNLLTAAEGGWGS
jgi:methylenetetrahydrofolate dehydrogenase (NADP+)/methenyltetrahydrofolate cyclohydrolase